MELSSSTSGNSTEGAPSILVLPSLFTLVLETASPVSTLGSPSSSSSDPALFLSASLSPVLASWSTSLSKSASFCWKSVLSDKRSRTISLSESPALSAILATQSSSKQPQLTSAKLKLTLLSTATLLVAFPVSREPSPPLFFLASLPPVFASASTSLYT